MEARRRTVLAAGAAGAAALVAGCSEYGDSGGGAASKTPTTQPATPSGEPSGTAAASPPAGEVLAKTSDIPVDGGKVFDAQKVVVTQPQSGEFKAFSAICTHQGCTVKTIADGIINCPCHGSKYRIADGSVAGGPAPKPLPPKQITVSGDTILLA
ncbi:Rieske (2Fe-2S) protein [Streptomyces sp. CA-135486]|uniref:Rieske (2Fe-2S) protein n=1 Tax=Streptomyces sp. CA-135486 TaxID=3240049 RepID=UPI003D8A1833